MPVVISIEGIDGSGKTTLAKAMADEMSLDKTFNPEIYLTKEPGSLWVPAAADIRKLVLGNPTFTPFERELLFYADASAHKRFIDSRPNSIIISDRGKWSHLAYLRANLKTKQLDHTTYTLCKKIIDEVCASPDCVIYLDGGLDLMNERLAGKEKDAIEINGDAFFSSVLETYQDLLRDRKHEGLPCLSLDASKPTCLNMQYSINYLKEVFSHDELKKGNRSLCSN